jgi:Fibronectin type III domain
MSGGSSWLKWVWAFALLFTVSLFPAMAVTLAWDANTEPDLAGYRIYYGTSPSLPNQSIDAGNATSTIIPNLQEGQTYYFTATAYNTSGLESAPSIQISYTVPTPVNFSQAASPPSTAEKSKVIWRTPKGISKSDINKTHNIVVTKKRKIILNGSVNTTQAIDRVEYSNCGGVPFNARGTRRWKATIIPYLGRNRILVRAYGPNDVILASGVYTVIRPE